MIKSMLHTVGRRLAVLGLFIAAATVLAAQSASTVTPVFAPGPAVISIGAPAYTLSFTASATETEDVVLTDLALAAGGGSAGLAPLTSLNLVVTSGGAVVPGLTSGTTATLAAAGTVSFAATSGTTYEIFVVGVPNATSSSTNTISVEVLSHTTSASIAYGTHSFAAASALPSSVYYASTPFKVTAAGDYVVTLVDQAAPVALTSLVALVISDAPNSTGIPVTAQAPVTLSGLAAGSYKIYVYAVANAAAQAGLFGLNVAPAAGGTALVNASVPVGLMSMATNLVTKSAQPLTLSATDLAEPVALTALSAAVTNGSVLLGQVSSGQSAAVNAPAGSLQIWQVATPATGSAGAYTVSLAPASGTALYAPLSIARDPAGTVYPYLAPVAAAGSYTPGLNDLNFPASFTTLSYQIYQAGAMLAQGAAGASLPAVSAQAGTLMIVVNAVPKTTDGVYSVSLTAAGAAGPLFAQVESIGPNLTGVPFPITTTGSYDVVVTDLGWPAPFASLNGLITQDGAKQGTIYGGGTLSGLSLPAGNYVATINGAPATGQTAGLYSLSVTPSAPVVTLSASPTTVPTSTGTRLTWTSTGATACTASATGPVPSSTTFTGTQATSGTDSEGPFTTAGSVVYTLSCTGPGGSAAATATVIVTSSSSSSSGGGGGAFGVAGLAGLGGLALLRRRSRYAR